MKKVLTFCLMLALVMSLSVSVFANGFVSSPSRNQAPELIEATNKTEDCVSEIIIKAYADRAELSDEARAQIEAAYASIVDTVDISSLNDAIADIVEDLGIKASDLAVSDLFDISSTDCEGHEDHGDFDIVLKAETLKNFVCLIHYYNGEWHVVDGAEVTNNGEHLEFTEGEFSPFAIVVSTVDFEPKKDNTAAVVTTVAVSTVAVAGAATGGYFFWKKRKSEDSAT